jgi:hypothetical protein
MTAPPADGVVIERVRLALPAGSPVEERRQALRARLLRASSWPTTAPGEVVIMARLKVRASWAELESAVVESVRGAVARARALGPSAGVVRFASEDALRVALLADLLDGVAAGRWWWRVSSWKAVLGMPKAAAVAHVLADEPLRLGALFAGLAAQGRLPALVAALDESAAARVYTAFLGAAGASSAIRSGSGIRAAAFAVLPPPLATMVQRRWSSALAGLAATDTRVRLAAAVAAAEARPSLLREGPRGAGLAALAELLIARPAPCPPVDQVDEPPPARASPAQASSALSPSPATVEARASSPPTPLAAGTDSRREDSPPEPQRVDSSGEPPLRPHFPVAPPDREKAALGETPPRPPSERPAAPRLAEAALSDEEIPTAHASTFYLVNALSRPSLHPLAASALDEPGGGWALLLAWARRLGLGPGDPLAKWLAQEAAALAGDPDPEGAASRLAFAHQSTLERLDAVATARYGADLWQPRLFAVPGLVRSTRTHVDVFMSLAHVRLEVRLAGLDLNPGWVPWLGRVVTLHYESEEPVARV